MKFKIKFGFTALIAFVTLASCKKQLDTLPEASLLQLTTFSNIKDALYGCYDGFQSNNY